MPSSSGVPSAENATPKERRLWGPWRLWGPLGK